ncbi:MAG: GAF and ANTAR domain-containing protein [Kineosporiaceae bacterium]|nr:GAF and ANTAR domain-containing protein [Kineosporiaceae bacterium]
MISPTDRHAAVQALIAAEPAEPEESAAPHGRAAGTVGWLCRLCRAAVRALSASGAGVSVMTPTGVHATAATSGRDVPALQNLQITLGEGPIIDAYASRRPVLVPDLRTAPSRWPGYASGALECGARAVFAFPLQIGAARLGVLDICRSTAGMLTAVGLQQAVTFAEVAAETLLHGQAGAPPGQTEAGLDRALDSQFVIYRAQGMAMVDLGVSLAEAMARLRAHAYAHDRPLQDVARDVVEGRLRLESDGP